MLTALSLLLLVLVIINVGGKQNITIGKLSLEEYNKLAPARNITGKVIVKYVDTEGNKLKDDSILTGIVGDIYVTARPEISAFKTYVRDPINKTGNYNKEDTVVTYIYQRKNDNVNINNDNNVITVQILDEQDKPAPEVKMNIIAENENGQVVTGGKYIVTDSNNLVIRDATSYVDKLLVGAIPLVAEGKEQFYITEVAGPEGCAPLGEKIQIEVNKTLSGTNYNVSASQLTSNSSVKVEMINGEIVITIKHIKAELFDLQLENQITEITVIKEDGEEKVTKQSPEEIIKIDLPKSKINNTKIRAKYAITITNVGELAGYAKEITNIIPEGMELIEGGNWEVTGNIGKNRGLENNLLNPGESITIYINMEWKSSEENIGLKTDKAYISDSVSSKNTPDTVSKNDVDDDSFMVSVRTGYTDKMLIAEIALAVLIIITIIVGIIRKRK